MKIFLILIFLISSNAFSSCPDTSRNNYSTGEVLTSSSLNNDFNQLVTKLNALSGECITNATVDMTTKPTGILPLANGGTGNVDYTSNVVTPTASAISALDIDWSILKVKGGIYTKTLSANSTFTFSNPHEGESIVVKILNTASNYTVTWPSILWSGGVTPTQTIGAKSDIYSFFYFGGTYYGTVVQNF